MARITRRSLPFRTSYVVAAAALVASLVVSPGAPAAAKDKPSQVEPAAREHGFVLEDGRFTSFDVCGLDGHASSAANSQSGYVLVSAEAGSTGSYRSRW
jgi:hypothetical protein